MNTITITGRVESLAKVLGQGTRLCVGVRLISLGLGRTRNGIKTESEIPFTVWFWQGQASAVQRSIQRGMTLIVTGRMTMYTHKAPAYQDSRGRSLTMIRYIVHADRWQIVGSAQEPSDDPGPPESLTDGPEPGMITARPRT